MGSSMSDRPVNPHAGQPSFKGISRTELLATFDDDLDFVRELVAAFTIRCPVLIQEIRDGVQAGDAGAISRAAHTLRGSIGYFDQREAYEAAAAIEKRAAEDLAAIPAILAALERQTADINLYLTAEFLS